MKGPELITGPAATGKTTYLLEKARRIQASGGSPVLVTPFNGAATALRAENPDLDIMTVMELAHKAQLHLTGNLWGYEFDTTWIATQRLGEIAKILNKSVGLEKKYLDRVPWFIASAERNAWTDEEWETHLFMWFGAHATKAGVLIERLYTEMINNNVAIFPLIFRQVANALHGYEGILGYSHVLVDDLQMVARSEFDFLCSVAGPASLITAAIDPDKKILSGMDGSDTDMAAAFQARFPGAPVVPMSKTRMGWSVRAACDYMRSCGTQQLPSDSDRVKLYRTIHESKEAERLLSHVVATANKYPDKRILVTYRTPWYGRNIARLAATSGLDADIRGLANQGIQESFNIVSDYLALAVNPMNGIAFLNAMNHPGRRLGDGAKEGLYLLRAEREIVNWFDIVDFAHEVEGLRSSNVKALAEFVSHCRALGSLAHGDLAACILDEIGLRKHLQAKFGAEADIAIRELERCAEKSVNAYECLSRLEIVRVGGRNARIVISPTARVLGERFDFVWINAVERGVFPMDADETAYWNDNLNQRDYRAMYAALSRADRGAAMLTAFARNMNGRWRKTTLAPMVMDVAELQREYDKTSANWKPGARVAGSFVTAGSGA